MEQSVFLRRATAEDATAIGALTRAAYAKWIAVTGREPLPMRVDYAVALQQHRFDVLVGSDPSASAETMIGVIETVSEPDGYLLLVNMAVHPSFQGQGHARQLLAAVDKQAAAADLSGVRLYTNKLFTQNIRLYRSYGYEIEQEAPLNGGVAVYMIKPRMK